jgi:beta-1,4-mannosyl-glycoprotein beta-1,4-N-acetylglucosaminyltransferase
MTMLIRSHITRFSSNTNTMVVMSDIDEIPAHHSVNLLKNCDFGSSIHLQLRDYLYRFVQSLLHFLEDRYLKRPFCSFEWYLGLTSWRASATIWNQNSYYRHSKSGERILADAGWHCSYCFRSLSEYIVKMKGFSHADRIAGRLNLLEPKRIQDTICKGKDIFGMLPEAYSVSKPLIILQQINNFLNFFVYSILTFFLRCTSNREL